MGFFQSQVVSAVGELDDLRFRMLWGSEGERRAHWNLRLLLNITNTGYINLI